MKLVAETKSRINLMSKKKKFRACKRRWLRSRKLHEIQETQKVQSSDLVSLERLKTNYQSELLILKEENSRVLTDFNLAKEQVKALNNNLKDTRQKIQELNQDREKLSNSLIELKTHSRKRDIKSEATLTLKQHKKLIEYLQERLEELKNKRKKMLADRLFGTPSNKEFHGRKENVTFFSRNRKLKITSK